ncbi:PAS-domain containing protein [Alteromonadaceae bacterium BrNp21-10]|nr:PAS-domain containing protein [Alteromonadaceae bacterium BrNp21-10]
MFSIWWLTLLALSYLAILFSIAFWGDRFHKSASQRPIIYSLALGVHCTSWAFYGTTTQSANFGWAFTPTYIGNIAVFVFGYPLLLKVIRFCQQHNISSLADFIGTQYGKSHAISALVTLICFIGVLPYTALQLDAVTANIKILAIDDPQWPGGVSFYVAVLMAVFAIIFGTRSLSLTEKHPGLMLAIAFESIVKLVAFIAVGLFVCYVLFDGVLDLLGKAQLHPQAQQVLHSDSAPWVYLSHVILGFASLFCLPRQFHITYVENNGEQELQRARWLYPLYLLAINLFVLPIALAGKILLSDHSPDSYVIALPMLSDNPWITMTAFIGGLSAATSMVIVATLAMGIMIANNLITPLWLKLRFRADQQHTLNKTSLLTIRRLTVILVVGMAYLYYQYLSQAAPLVNSGIIAMALLAQLAPGLLIGLYWQRRRKAAAVISLLAGGSIWLVYLLWPSIKASYYFENTPDDFALAQGVFLSLGVNLVCYVLVCLIPIKRRAPIAEQEQGSPTFSAIKIETLLAVTEKVMSPQQQQQWHEKLSGELHGYASAQLVRSIESELAAHVGNASARILLSAITEKQQVPLHQLVDLVEEASQSYQFNHELLRSSVEHIEQGISVIDRNLKLLAWNQRYISLFHYPENYIKAGMPVRDLLQFNARRGLFAEDVDQLNIIAQIDKRIAYLQQGSSYKYLRTQPDGTVIELQGNPMPGGGFVTTYSDITEHVKIQQQLQESKQTLEQRVIERTEQLQDANHALKAAKLDAEKANDSKTKFLAAAGHDLMQPFNAATLYASMIEQQSQDQHIQQMAQSLLQSLNNAEELLSMLLDMTKLESGVLNTHLQPFPLDELLQPLVQEFTLQAKQKGLTLHYVPTQIQVLSDKKLLRRVIQNLLSNAIRYTQKGKVLIGVRRQQQQVQLYVYDTGVGIAKHQQQEIFNEFHQLDQHNRQGLGLGLTIVERICHLLQHPVKVHSELAKGTSFSVVLPRVHNAILKKMEAKTPQDSSIFLQGKHILIIDNEIQILNAMQQLFSQWGANVTTAVDLQQAIKMITTADLMLVDYHLNQGEIGVEVAQKLQQHWQQAIPTIINTADYSDIIHEQAVEAGFVLLRKPVKTGTLKKLVKKLLADN